MSGYLLGLVALLPGSVVPVDANTTTANRSDSGSEEVATTSVCTRSDSAAEQLFSLAGERSDELTFLRIPVRVEVDPMVAAGEQSEQPQAHGQDESIIGISMNRDVFRSRLNVDEVRLEGDASALGVSPLFCVEYRERSAALVISNPAKALGPQLLLIRISRAGVRQTLVGRTPALPSATSLPLLLDADEPLRSGGGPAHVAVVIGE